MELRSAVFGRADWPTVSVVMPVRNEAPDLEKAVRSILDQDYPLPFDLCLAVGPSDDDTVQIAERLAAANERVLVVDNPTGLTPAGLNAAIAATVGEVIVRVDGHAMLSDGYIRTAVETMRSTGAVNVGGIQDAVGETPFEESVAAAMTSWLGTGGSRFHVGGEAGPVDTVYLGVFDRAAGDLVGWFDERLIRNQDYELNIRLRTAGGVVWFDPQLSARYRPRGSLRSLGRQYFDYGLWKAEVLVEHPGSLKLRQAVPASIVPFAGLALLSRRRRILLLAPIAYLAAAAQITRRDHRPAMSPMQRLVCTAGALLTIHTSWSAGFTRSVLGMGARLIRSPRR